MNRPQKPTGKIIAIRKFARNLERSIDRLTDTGQKPIPMAQRRKPDTTRPPDNAA